MHKLNESFPIATWKKKSKTRLKDIKMTLLKGEACLPCTE